MSWLYQSPAVSFDAGFESGNLASAERVAEFEYDLFIQPDHQTSTRLWFYFRCSQVPIGLPVVFNIIGISKTKTTYTTQQRILVRSTSRTKWQRMPQNQQFYTTSQKHKCYTSTPVLSYIFQFDRQEEYFFAFGYPYTYSMLQKFIARIQDHSLPFVQVDTLGLSFQQRQINLLTIGRPLLARYKNDQKPTFQHTVLITARCHSGEFPGSYVCHGILEYLMSNNPRAKFLRQNVIFKIVPMINVDGVMNGFYRTNANGFDLNRNFYEPPASCPEALLLRTLFEQLIGPAPEQDNYNFTSNQTNSSLLDLALSLNLLPENLEAEQVTDRANSSNSTRSEQTRTYSQQKQRLPKQQLPPTIPSQSSPKNETKLDFVIDLHSHSNIAGGFLFLNPDSGTFNRQKRASCEQVFPALLAKNCSTFNSLNTSFKESKNTREGSLRRAFMNISKDKLTDESPYIYCLEVSNSHGPDPREGGKGILKQMTNEDSEDDQEDENIEQENYVSYTPEKYMNIGEKICDTLYEIYSGIFKQ